MKLPGFMSKFHKNTVLFLFIPIAFIFSIPASALTSKEQWAKDNAERLMIEQDSPLTLLDTGGPDSYGYYFYDSQDSAVNAPTYQWIDISNIGDTLHFNQDDQNLGPYEIGFPFTYYGQDYATFRLCSNGWLSFGSNSSAYLNRPIPTGDNPNNLLAVFWDDLLPGTGRVFRYSNDFDTCIVAWQHFQHYPDMGDYTFEIILTGDGSIVFQYQQLTGPLNSHTIGLENSSGTDGLQYVYNSYKDESQSAIYFGMRPPHYAEHDVMPSSFREPAPRGVVNDTIYPLVRFTNAGDTIESFNVRLRIFHNGEIYNQLRRVSVLHPDSSSLAILPSFIPTDPGAYELIATSELANDLFPLNDTLSFSYFAHNSIYSTDFEADSTSFAGNRDWRWGTPTRGPASAHSGVRLWGTILDGNYNIGPRLSTLYSDTLFVGDTATLTFWHWYSIEALFDGGNVKISTDDGGSWTILTPDDGYDGIISSSFQNPLGNQPGFYGVSGGWRMETIDLSSYSGSVAIIKFDFGSDDSGNSFGWYIDDFTALNAGAASPGWLMGTVCDTYGEPVPDAQVQAGRRSVLAGSMGGYFMELSPGAYAVTASAPYYDAVTSGGILIAAGDTTTLQFFLTSPVLEADTSAIDTTVTQGHYLEFNRQLTNVGDGPLDYNIRVNLQRIDRRSDRFGKMRTSPSGYENLPLVTDFGDEVFTFDPQTPSGDDGCTGVEFDGRYFWITGRHGVDEFHKLHKFDRDGNLIESYEQNTISLWGWRDLAFDGRYLYSSDENELAVIDTATGQKIDTLPMPSDIPPPLRGLAYDPSTHHFWAANFLSNIIEFDNTGQTLHSFSNDHHIFGLAWDYISSDGPWLWVFSDEGGPLASQFDPRTGGYTGLSFGIVDHNGGIPDQAGGASFSAEWDQSRGVLFCLVMGRTTQFDSFDNVQGYEITSYPRWLSVTPASGTIGPSESQILSIRIDFSDSSFVPDSLFRGSIEVGNNSRYTPLIPVNAGVLSSIDDAENALPREFTLYQNYPNPFNSSTIIRFALPQASSVRLEIFNILGQKAAIILDDKLEAGFHSIRWNASGVSSGIYYARLYAGGISRIQPMVLLK